MANHCEKIVPQDGPEVHSELEYPCQCLTTGQNLFSPWKIELACQPQKKVELNPSGCRTKAEKL